MTEKQYTPESKWARDLRLKANGLLFNEPCLTCCSSDAVAAQAVRDAVDQVGYGNIRSIHQFLDYLSEATRLLQLEELEEFLESTEVAK